MTGAGLFSHVAHLRNDDDVEAVVVDRVELGWAGAHAAVAADAFDQLDPAGRFSPFVRALMGGQGCTEAQHISVRDRHAARTRSQQERLLSVQRSGTSSGPIVIGRVVSEGTILVSDPTWENHRAVSGRAGLRVPDYRYLDDSVRFVGIEGTPAGPRGAGPGSVVLPDHAARNPSGYGTGRGRWRSIVNNAGVVSDSPITEMTDRAWQRVLDVKLGVFSTSPVLRYE